MADPKTSGPDPLRLLLCAEEALDTCEYHEPGPIPADERDAARRAVEIASPHLPYATAERLKARLLRLPKDHHA